MNKMIKNILNKIKKNKVLSGVGLGLLVVIILGLVYVFSGNGESEIVRPVKRDLLETVKISGRVEADIVSDLGFSVSGRAVSVPVKVNDKVFSGQRLATLDLGTLPAELRSAEADVSIKQAELKNKTVNLETITQKQNTLVESSYKKLLSEGLEPEPSSENYTQTPPTISGLYTGLEGTYKLIIDTDSTGTDDFDLTVFGLEKTGQVRIKETSATPLGTKGLFIDFPDGASEYENTIWYLNIPNTKSSDYLDNKNAYDEAVKARDQALEDAQAELRSNTNANSSVALAQLEKAKAGADKIRAEIGQKILSAPFTGVVTAVNLSPGETVNANEGVISIISEGKLGVTIDLPEVDSVKVRIGDEAKITLDAIGQDKIFMAKVVSVNRSETLSDGIPIYEAKLAFVEDNADIISGMTADVTIVTDSKQGVLALPVRAVKYKDDGATYVVALDSRNKEKEIKVVTGLRSTDGFIEIVAGLSGSEQVVVAK